MPVSYNFVSGVIAGGGHRPSTATLDELLTELDYINVHVYGGAHSNRQRAEWTPHTQIGAFKGESQNVMNGISAQVLATTPVIIGESGYQSRGYASTSKAA